MDFTMFTVMLLSDSPVQGAEDNRKSKPGDHTGVGIELSDDSQIERNNPDSKTLLREEVRYFFKIFIFIISYILSATEVNLRFQNWIILGVSE